MSHEPYTRPAFLVTIDTEGDNLWSRPHDITTRNADYLPRFQALCEQYGLKATYLTDWEMVKSPTFRRFAAQACQRGAAEIGMHLHAWNTPPIVPLTADDYVFHPFLIEYPDDQMRDKVRVMTAELEDTFGTKMVSHRAGRWSFNARYARILAESGYRVDCSVTPHVSWKATAGAPGHSGGTDFSSFPEQPYFLDLEDIGRSGNSSLLEVPVSIVRRQRAPLIEMADTLLGERGGTIGRRIRGRFPPYVWLRPDGRNRDELLTVVNVALEDGRNCIEFMLHSSELMPGGSPTFPTAESIERLYSDLEALFSAASQHFAGQALAEYYDSSTAHRADSRQATEASFG